MGRFLNGDEQFSPSAAHVQRFNETRDTHVHENPSFKALDDLNRALSSPLDPGEVNTLGQIAGGVGNSEDANESHVAHLVLLKLVTRKGSSPVITMLGKHRLALES